MRCRASSTQFSPDYDAHQGCARAPRFRRSDRTHAGPARPAPTRPGCSTSSTRGIDHILVDEAQDTCARAMGDPRRLDRGFRRRRWRARPRPRTFFAVGDEKQSIFSFQGAAPHMFDEMRREFARRLRRRRAAVRACAADAFVSLRARRAVGGRQGVRASRTSKRPRQRELDVWMPHEGVRRKNCRRSSKSGRRSSPRPRDEPARLAAAARSAGRDGSRQRRRPAHRAEDRALARRRARPSAFSTRASALRPVPRGRHPHPGAHARPASSSRDPRAEAEAASPSPAPTGSISPSISPCSISVAAAARRCCRDDDLTLAAVLKSPLIGFDDDDLIKIAPQPPGQSLRGAAAAREREFSGRRQRSSTLARAAPRTSPFRFLFAACSARMAGGARLKRGLDRKRPMRSTSFCVSRSRMSGDGAFAYGLPRRFRGGGALDQARYGKRRRRRAGHDRACGEGARSQDRLPARYLRRAGASA